MSLCACDQRPAPLVAPKISAANPTEQDVDELEAGIRLAAANKRIDELERKVSMLEATPEKLDLDLISQRVAALEVKAASTPSIEPKSPALKGSGDDMRSPRAARGSDAGSRQKASPSSKLNLPELEGRPQLATPAEARAFSEKR
jgi:hypothetical protein